MDGKIAYLSYLIFFYNVVMMYVLALTAYTYLTIFDMLRYALSFVTNNNC